MVASASSYIRDERVTFEVGNAQDILSFVPPQSLDLIVSGQAAHWFASPETYATFAKALKPGGILAYFVCFANSEPFEGFSEVSNSLMAQPICLSTLRYRQHCSNFC